MNFMRVSKKILAGTLSLLMLSTGVGFGGSALAADAQIKAYAKAPYEETCPLFSLTADGTPVDVVQYFDGRYSYAHLAFSGTASFEISLLSGQAITGFDISPHSYGLNAQAQADQNKLTFEMSQAESRYLVISITTGQGRLRNLVIAADPIDQEGAPTVDGEQVIDITAAPYHADPTGQTNVTATLQKAVEDMGKRGGGTVYVPAGVYQFTYIDFTEETSNVTLYLDEGAVLRGSSNRADYEWNGSGSGNIQGRRNIQFIGGVKNVAITGRGMIDANSTVLVEPKPGQKPTGWDDYRKGIVESFAQNGKRPDGITLSGVTIKDATGWTFSLNDSLNITITHLKMLNDDDFVHSDGYDICACQNVLVDQCFGYTGDDVFCAKGNNAAIEMKDITFQNGVAYASGGAGCKVGVQSKSDASNIVFQNIDVIQGYRGFSISHDEGAGDWKDIRFIDIRTERLHVANPSDTGQYRAAPFVIWTLQRNNEIGTVRDVEVTRCSIEDTAGLKGIIKGENAGQTPGIISGVHFTDFTMDGQSITGDNYLRKINVGANTEGLTFENSQVIQPDYTVYEAEAGRLSGEAQLIDAADCSGGQKVGSLGGDGGGCCLIRNVYANRAGRYTMTLYYSTFSQRSFFISVNRQDSQEIVCEGNGMDWTTRSALSVPVRLEKGVNTILFHNPTGEFCPDLDKIEIDNLSLDPPPTPGLVYLSDLPWESATTGWEGNPPQRDLSVEKNPLRIRVSKDNTAAQFAKGTGAHAVSEIVVDVSALACERFQAYAAPDVEAVSSNRSSVTFQVYADDRLVYESGVLRRDSDAVYIDVDITGAKKLRLVAGDGGDGVNNDHADWADAKLITKVTAQDIADTLDAPLIQKGQTTLPLPEVPEGFTVALTDSSSHTIQTDGVITPPAEDQRVTLTYTVSKNGTDETGTTTLMVTVPGVGAKPDWDVSIQPESAGMLTGTALQFIAEVTGGDSGVRWTVEGNTSDQTQIDQEGLLTAAADERAKTLTVTAWLQEDGTVSASTEISLYTPGDLDGDREVTIADVMEACKVLARKSANQAPSDFELLVGNIDGDADFTIGDVMEICKILARKG